MNIKWYTSAYTWWYQCIKSKSVWQSSFYSASSNGLGFRLATRFMRQDLVPSITSLYCVKKRYKTDNRINPIFPHPLCVYQFSNGEVEPHLFSLNLGWTFNCLLMFWDFWVEASWKPGSLCFFLLGTQLLRSYLESYMWWIKRDT